MESVSVSKYRLMGEEVATRRSQEVRVALSPSEDISLPSQVRCPLICSVQQTHFVSPVQLELRP